MSIDNNEDKNKLNTDKNASDEAKEKTEVRKKKKTVSIKSRISAQEAGEERRPRSIRERKAMAVNDDTGFLDDGLTMQLPQIDDKVSDSLEKDEIDTRTLKSGSEKAKVKKAADNKVRTKKTSGTATKKASGTVAKKASGTATKKASGTSTKKASGASTKKVAGDKTNSNKAADNRAGIKKAADEKALEVKNEKMAEKDSASEKSVNALPKKNASKKSERMIAESKSKMKAKATSIVDEDDFDEDDYEEENYLINQKGNKDGKDSLIKQHRKMQGYKKVLIGLCVLAVFIGIGYCAGISYFGKHFAFHTTINGQDCSLKTPEEVEKIFSDEVGDYALSIEERDGSTEKIDGSSINLSYKPGSSISDLLSKQDNTHWIKSLISKNKLNTQLEVTYDSSKLKKAVKALNCMQKDNQKKAKSAKPEYDGEKFAITAESQGTVVKSKVMLQAVSDAVTSLQTSVNLVDAECYKLPKYTSKSEEVTEACDTMNKYIQSKIVYKLQDDKTQTLSGDKIAKWLSVNSDMDVEINEESVNEYVEKIADKCDTYGENISFKKTGGGTVKVSGYEYGYRVDQDKEYKKLLSNIKSGKTVNREPEYSQRGDEGIGDTYAEVDLKNQHMYFYKDGKQKLSCDIVSGNPNNGNETPTGLYKVAYTQKDKVLRGEQQEDGSYEYESPVSYWMPFNGGIGFHDATWQSSFGGSRYLTNGSHGCINMPLDQAKKLYGLISAGDPVILYK